MTKEGSHTFQAETEEVIAENFGGLVEQIPGRWNISHYVLQAERTSLQDCESPYPGKTRYGLKDKQQHIQLTTAVHLILSHIAVGS